MTKKPVINAEQQLLKPKRKAPANFLAHSLKPGQTLNPNGRPKGSRHKFSETFLKDFLSDWEQHGAEAISKMRQTDPSGYVKVGASLLPKDFNLNLTNEAELDKILDQFDDTQLRAMLAAIAAAGAHTSEAAGEESIRSEPNRVH